MTASVAAMTGGESMTINLYLERSSAMASTSLWEESRSAGFGGRGPVGMAARVGIEGCGLETRSRLDTPAREELRDAYCPLPRLRRRPVARLRRAASTWTV